VKCDNCGAPVTASSKDLSYCPHCNRKLLALASPACSYCGKWLPEKYLHAREGVLRRITDIRKSSEEAMPALVMAGSGRRKPKLKQSKLFSMVELFDLTDLF
jgi:hypothetical protein